MSTARSRAESDLDAVESRVRAELLNRLASVRCVCDERHIRLRGKQPGDTLPHDRVIVDAENSDSLGIVAH